MDLPELSQLPRDLNSLSFRLDGIWPSCEEGKYEIWYATLGQNGRIFCLLHSAFYDRDPVDLAVEWADGDPSLRIPVIMPANDKRPGGDWETGEITFYVVSFLSR